MAGDWIAMRTDLDEDPAVVGVAATLSIPEAHVIGLLWKLWSLANRQTQNGWLANYTIRKVDAVVGLDGFAAALASTGWLHISESGVRIPNFDRWLANSAKSRLASARRMAKSRSKKSCADVALQAQQKRNVSTVLSSSNAPPLEELSNVAARSPPKRDGPEFLRFWEAYPRKQGKEDARKAWKQAAPSEDEQQAMLAVLEVQRKSEQWAKDGGQFIPMPATYLRGRRWEDEGIKTAPAPDPLFRGIEEGVARIRERMKGVNSQ